MGANDLSDFDKKEDLFNTSDEQIAEANQTG